MDFYRFCDEADDAARQRASRRLIRVALRSLYVHRAFNADPHPGNYRFTPSGEVGFLDFGCVRQLDADWVATDRAIVTAVLAGDRAAFRDAVQRSGIVGSRRFDDEAHWEMVSWQWRPYLTETLVFTPAYLAEGAKLSRPSNPNLRHLAIPPQGVWVERLRWGLSAVLTRLGAAGRFRPLLEEALAAPEVPLDGYGGSA